MTRVSIGSLHVEVDRRAKWKGPHHTRFHVVICGSYLASGLDRFNARYLEWGQGRRIDFTEGGATVLPTRRVTVTRGDYWVRPRLSRLPAGVYEFAAGPLWGEAWL